jgi:acetyl esterase/lipase
MTILHHTGAAAAAVLDERYMGSQRELDVRVHRPCTGHARAVMVLFHGGGFMRGDLESIAPLAARIAERTDVAVATPRYTLATERPFPASAEDAYAAIVWAAAKAQRARCQAPRLIVAGVEAGGNLAAVVAMMARDRGGPAIAAQILITPMLDPTLTSRSMQRAASDASRSSTQCNACYRAYLPHAADRMHPYASPSSALRVAGVSPALILTAAGDPLRDEAEAYGAKLIAAGVTTQVSRMSCVEAERGAWSEEDWSLLVSFVAARIEPQRAFR